MNMNPCAASQMVMVGPTIRKLFPNASKDCIEANRGGDASCRADTDTINNATVSSIRRSNGAAKVRSSRRAMNKTEKEFSLKLEAQRQSGEIRDWMFQPFALPWADMKYTPDFMVTPNSGKEKRKMIEVKGPHIHYRQQAIARFKGARSYWPEFQFELWQKQKSDQWKQLY